MHIKSLLQERTASLVISIILLSLAMTFMYPGQFGTVANFSQLLLNLSIDTIVAVGMMILLIGGMFDLSVSAS
jgi:ribose transport system permease protein